MYLFLPPGLASAPGWNEQYVGEIVRVASLDMPISVARFVDDLRIVNNASIPIEQDEHVLNLQLHTLKLVLEQLGMKIHSKPGKLIPATQCIEWIGWSISTTSLRISLTDSKRLRGLSLCSDLLDRHFAHERITARRSCRAPAS